MVPDVTRDRVFACLDRDALAELAITMGNIQAPTGSEQAYADWVLDWLQENGIPAYQQQVAPGRANVVGVIKGAGGGSSLLFNSHLDSDLGCQLHPDDWTRRTGALGRGWMEGDHLFGVPVLNDRGPMACFMMAARALRNSSVSLAGDVVLTMVVGEIGQAPIDEFQGTQYLGKGLGSRHAVAHGVAADFAVVCETTDFGVTWGECGCGYYKITVPGVEIYAPRTFRPERVEEHPNAVVRAARVIAALEDWGRRFEQERQMTFAAGTIVPKVNIGGIRGGTPYSPAFSVGQCSIYLDVRIPPNLEPVAVQRELESVVGSLGLGVTVQPFMVRRGYIGSGVEPLVSAVRSAHQAVRGEPPPPVPTAVTSMWRDLNVFNEVGIPAVTFGPPRRTEDGGAWRGTTRRYFTKDDLLQTAKIYALTALDICGVNQAKQV